MGKIFKALEKAEQQSTVRKKKPKKDLDLLRGVRPRTNSVALRNTVNDGTLSSLNNKKKKASSITSKARSINKKREQQFVDSFYDQKTTQSFDSQLRGRETEYVRSEKIAGQKTSNSPSVRATSAEPLFDSENRSWPNSGRYHEEQKLADVAYNVQDLNLSLGNKSAAEKKNILVHHPKKSINVKYSRTKVQVNDPKKLQENNVLSVFEDFETTNQFKILRTQVLRKLKESGGNSILVTSANPCEGKTFTSINLGVSIAKEFDRTVLIIDADVRRPATQHTDFSTEFFSLQVGKGLTDYLVGDADLEEVLINPGIDKLTLIPGGVPVDNSPELLNSPRMEEMMAEIKSRYPSDRVVIVDGPAILHFPDALILSRYVDGVLPVVESERTASEDVKKMMANLKEVNILGVVLNKNKL